MSTYARTVIVLLVVLVLAGCSRMLMPTPCVFWSGEVDPFAEFTEDHAEPIAQNQSSYQ